MMTRLVLCFFWRPTWVLIHTMSSLAFSLYGRMRVMPFPRVVTVCGWRTWVYQPISIIDEQICFISSLCVEMMTAAPCWASSHSIRITTLALS